MKLDMYLTHGTDFVCFAVEVFEVGYIPDTQYSLLVFFVKVREAGYINNTQ